MEFPKSKGNWGKQKERTVEELNAICRQFFIDLITPPEWKPIAWDPCTDVSPAIPLLNERGDNGGKVISVGKVFRDMRTSGIDLRDYRVFFCTYSERGGICEKIMVDFGKYKKMTVISNKTAEKLNEWIKDKYWENPSASLDPLQGDINPGDGLQHFRDRFCAGTNDTST